MYICKECGKTFDEPKILHEHHPYGEGYVTEKWVVCPFCKEAGISEAVECERCGALVAETNDGLCDVCWDDMFYA